MNFSTWLESNPFADKSHIFSADPVHGIGGILGSRNANPNARTMLHQPGSDVQLAQTGIHKANDLSKTAIHNNSLDTTMVQSIMSLLTKIDTRLSRLETKLI